LQVGFNTSSASSGLLPVYNWTMPDKYSHQNAYQILVSSSQTNIHHNLGDIWNSGRIDGDRPEDIKHGGSGLQPGHTYFWKVRIWDGDNRLTEYTSPMKFTAR